MNEGGAEATSNGVHMTSQQRSKRSKQGRTKSWHLPRATSAAGILIQHGVPEAGADQSLMFTLLFKELCLRDSVGCMTRGE
jgi:hypothetical protein